MQLTKAIHVQYASVAIKSVLCSPQSTDAKAVVLRRATSSCGASSGNDELLRLFELSVEVASGIVEVAATRIAHNAIQHPAGQTACAPTVFTSAMAVRGPITKLRALIMFKVPI